MFFGQWSFKKECFWDLLTFRVSLSFSQHPSTTPSCSCGQDRENLEHQRKCDPPIFFSWFLSGWHWKLLVSFQYLFFSSRTETKLASHINIFNNIHSETILTKIWLRFGHILTMLGPFLITFLTQVKLKGLWSHLMTKSTLLLWTLNVSYLKKRKGLISKQKKRFKLKIVWQFWQVFIKLFSV